MSDRAITAVAVGLVGVLIAAAAKGAATVLAMARTVESYNVCIVQATPDVRALCRFNWDYRND